MKKIGAIITLTNFFFDYLSNSSLKTKTDLLYQADLRFSVCVCFIQKICFNYWFSNNLDT